MFNTFCSCQIMLHSQLILGRKKWALGTISSQKNTVKFGINIWLTMRFEIKLTKTKQEAKINNAVSSFIKLYFPQIIVTQII